MEELPERWRPSASLEALRERARMLASIRAFFSQRACLEVTTPALGRAGTMDPQIESFCFDVGQGTRYLQTSPEFHMKRLLAAGSGPIYQLAPAFRAEEQGRWHNPEFTLLEWYRPGIDHHQLMDELEALWQMLTQSREDCERVSYAQLFQRHLSFSVSSGSDEELRGLLQQRVGQLPAALDRDGLLDAAMALLIGPQLGLEQACFVYDYPASQAALARLGASGWASRFELYWKGLELANGFHELCDVAEQRRRFEQDLEKRRHAGQTEPPMDTALLEALAQGMPECAGVAVGVDRLAALLQGHKALASVMAFPAHCA